VMYEHDERQYVGENDEPPVDAARRPHSQLAPLASGSCEFVQSVFDVLFCTSDSAAPAPHGSAP
jgi:hypothetical protein